MSGRSRLYAENYAIKNGVKILSEVFVGGCPSFKVAAPKKKDQVFRSGYHPGLKEYVKGPKHYSKLLKEKGLVECGNEAPSKKEKKASGLSDSQIKEAVQGGAMLSGNEITALKNGEKLHK